MLEAQMQREEAMMSVSICEQVVQEEREQELGDIEEMNENNGQGRLDNAPTRSVQGEERVSLLKVNINDKHSLINQSELVERGAEFISSDQPVGLANTPVPKLITHANSSNHMPEFQGINSGSVGQTTAVPSSVFPLRPSTFVVPPRLEPTVLPTNTYSLHWTLTHLVLSYQQPSYNPQIWDTTWNPYMCNVGLPPLNSNHGAQVSGKIDTNIEIVKALKQVVATPKIEYMHFDGNPIKFPSFMHNFETCLERNNDSDESKLQLLIQHCHGKAKEAIETCVNLPADEGYCVAKKTLTDNFGKPHIIARAHIKKLVNLPSIKKADGPSLLEFARHLESTNRTLKGMGPEYVSDLDHVNTLKELNRKLPMFMKARWTEKAGKIYEGNSTPRFEDFLNFIKKKATLMNNEFGDDLTSSDSKDRSKEKWRNNEKGGRFNKENIALMVGMKRDENGKLNSREFRGNFEGISREIHEEIAPCVLARMEYGNVKNFDYFH